MSTRSDNAGEAKPLLPLIFVPQFRATFAVWPFLLTASSAGNPWQERPEEHKTEVPKLDDSFTFLETKMEEMMQFMEDAVHYTERSEGQLHESLFHQRAFILTYLQKQHWALLVLSQQSYSLWSKIVPGNSTQQQKSRKLEYAITQFSVVTSGNLFGFLASLLILV